MRPDIDRSMVGIYFFAAVARGNNSRRFWQLNRAYARNVLANGNDISPESGIASEECSSVSET